MLGSLGPGPEASRMTTNDGALTVSGWSLGVGAAASGPAAVAAEVHAIYSGDAFDNPGRGIIAAVARGLGSGRPAGEAAQIAAHSLAEGYFGAAATLGAARAADLALASVNAWMFSQSRADRVMAAALSALIFVGRHARIIHIGDCRIYRRRGGAVAPLTTDHVRPLPDGTSELSRAVGGDAELHVEYAEDAAEPADRYIILSRGGYAGVPAPALTVLLTAELAPEALAERIASTARDADPGDACATAVVIDVLKLPAATFDDMAAAFARLPLRGAPRDGENWDGFELGPTLYRSRYTVLKRARDTATGADVVIKIPLPSMLHDQVFRAGFLREAWIGATVRSRFVARYIDVPAERRSSLYLVLPYYRGETIEARVQRPPPISYLDGIGIALKLCVAVRDLDRLQIIHRDLKPENVVLLPNGDIKLIDLGLAYLPGIDEPDDDRLGGTTRFMAPELFRGRPADQRSEVFSLGVTIYRMFTGAFPFGQREIVPLARLRPDLPGWLGQCLARAMAMERDARFADAAELAAALEAGLAQSPRPPALPPRWYALSPRRIWQALTLLFAAAFFVLLALVLAGRR
jgi:serine/threonine protein phosphatase PrpC